MGALPDICAGCGVDLQETDMNEQIDPRLLRAVNDHQARLRYDCRPQYALLGALVLLALVLAGCSPYWVKDSAPVPVFAVVEVDMVNCLGLSADILGCADRSTGLIQIKRGHPLKDCIEAHERKHLAGWSHRPGRPLGIDCGDGRIYP